jgi:hypothetical protein
MKNPNRDDIMAVKVTVKTLTKEDLDKMTPAEMVKPLIGCTWRTIFEYEKPGPGSRKELSKLEKPAEFFLDTSEEGNNSFYGEDWGAPPKKATVSRNLDPLYYAR